MALIFVSLVNFHRHFHQMKNVRYNWVCFARQNVKISLDPDSLIFSDRMKIRDFLNIFTYLEKFYW